MSEQPGDINQDQAPDALPDGGQSDGPEAEGSGAEGSEAEGSGDPALTAAQAQIAALKDQLLRAQAEMDNLRRRNQRDVENAHKYGVERLLGEMPALLDSFEKGMESASALGGETAVAVAEGLTLCHKLFLAALARYGVTPVDPRGEPFNPKWHEAIAMVANPDMEPNSVMDVLQRGYLLHDRVLRAAKVVVTKAP